MSQRALGTAGATLADVVSVIVYLADVDDWGKFNTAYKDAHAVARSRRAPPLGANLRGILVEVSAVAYAPTRELTAHLALTPVGNNVYLVEALGAPIHLNRCEALP